MPARTRPALVAFAWASLIALTVNAVACGNDSSVSQADRSACTAAAAALDGRGFDALGDAAAKADDRDIRTEGLKAADLAEESEPSASRHATVVVQRCKKKGFDYPKPSRKGCSTTVFLEPTVSSVVVERLGQRLKALLPGREIEYVDQDEAFTEYKQLFKDNDDLRDVVSASDLPPSYRVTETKAGDAGMISGMFSGEPDVQSVNSPC